MTQPFAPQGYPAATIPLAGMVPPNPLYYPINQAILPAYVPPLDFTTVTAVTIHVARPDGSAVQWVAGSLASVTADGLIAIYLFQAGDGTVDGAYALRPYLSVPGFPNSIPCSSSTLTVTFR